MSDLEKAQIMRTAFKRALYETHTGSYYRAVLRKVCIQIGRNTWIAGLRHDATRLGGMGRKNIQDYTVARLFDDVVQQLGYDGKGINSIDAGREIKIERRPQASLRIYVDYDAGKVDFIRMPPAND